MRRSFLLLLLLLGAATAFALVQASDPRDPAAAPPALSAPAPPLVTPSPCPPGWTLHEPPASGGALYAVAARAPDDAWAVGGYNETVTDHWNGTTWQYVPSPNTGGSINVLQGVAAKAADDAWAVGYALSSSNRYVPLALHWDGTAWTDVALPTPGGDEQGTGLNGVTMIAADDVWAVGEYRPAGGPLPWILHWNGSAWSESSIPAFTPDTALEGVTATGPDDVWAVGYEEHSMVWHTLTLHWDGSTWSRIPSPNPSGGGDWLASVSALAPDDVWAAGGTSPGSTTVPLGMHWDGSAWTAYPAPNPGNGVASFRAIVAVGPGDVWAAGNYRQDTVTRPLAERWDGTAWQPVPIPLGAIGDHDLYAAAASGPDDVWLTGYYTERSGGAWVYLAEHYSPDCATATPTPSPTPECGPSTGTWQSMAPYPIPVYSAAVVGHAGAVYSFGGFIDWNYSITDQAFRYDPGANTWTAIAPLPEARGAASAVSDGRYIYIVNGATGNLGARVTVWRYDPATNTYTTLASSPHATFYQTAALLDGRIYRMGGSDLHSSVADVDVYTIATDTWAPPGTVAGYPLALEGMAVTAADGYLWAAGGRTSMTQDTDKTYRYDPAANVWQDAPIADLPDSRALASSGVLGGVWLLAGGRVADYDSAGVVGLDLHDPGGLWQSFPALPSYRSDAGGTSLPAAMYAVGGSPYPISETLRYAPALCTPTVTPTVPPVTPTSTGTPTAAMTTPPSPTASLGTPTPTAPRPTATLPAPTATPLPRATPLPGSATAPVPSATPGPPAATPTPCPISFADVHESDYFYGPVEDLACRGVISGYADQTFRPYAPTTRAQLVKIVVLGFGRPIATPAAGYTFADVPAGAPFFDFIQTAAAGGLVSGYTCGGPGEPCDAQGRPYFRPNAGVTRGQLTKIDVTGAGWPTISPPGPGTFTDVPPASPFYPFVETAACHQVISGYADGTFRPGGGATRGQIAKIVDLSITAGTGCARP